MNNQSKHHQPCIAIVPAAGVGKRMKANCPKQYLKIEQLTVLEHTVQRLLSHPLIDHVVLPVSADDGYITNTTLHRHPNVTIVHGGKERVDSVYAGLQHIDTEKYAWVLVHDAARPCITHADISKLIDSVITNKQGAILATPVRDTMKRYGMNNTENSTSEPSMVTVERSDLWHALTPQMYKPKELLMAISQAKEACAEITDEASAIEFAQLPSHLVEGRGDNIKITRPDDLALATFILQQQHVNK